MRHQLLYTIFDGVPKDSTSAHTSSNTSAQTTNADSLKALAITQKMIAAQGVTHPPYLSRDCKMCHDDGMKSKTRIKQPDLCYECHSNFKDKYKYLHGPVVGGYCTTCHSPHFSKNAKLVLRTGQQICLYCHQKEAILKNEVHKEINETSCTECHNPHGGDDKFILR